MTNDKIEVKGKTVYINGKELGSAKLECDAQFAAQLIRQYVNERIDEINLDGICIK